MWLIALRDLQMRRRRFLVGVIAVGVVFGITLLLDGFTASLRNEVRRTVAAFDADVWVVAPGSAGPFTPDRLIVGDLPARLARVDGVRSTNPLLIASTTMDTGEAGKKIVGVIGSRDPLPLSSGRWPRRTGEIAADGDLSTRIGSDVHLLGHTYRVVGRLAKLRYFAGTSAFGLRLADMRNVMALGQPLSSAIVVHGRLGPGKGYTLMSNADVAASLRRPVHSAGATIGFLDVLLWFVAAGIIGTILYMTSLERIRDFAALKAIGARTSDVLVAVGAQALVLSVLAGVVGVIASKLLAPIFPMYVEIPTRSYVLIFVVALAIGMLGSAAGVNRAVRTDPALAFGG